jgi:hypothetical protein
MIEGRELMFYNDLLGELGLWRSTGGDRSTDQFIRDDEETQMETVLKTSYIQSTLHDITARPLLYFIRVRR